MRDYNNRKNGIVGFVMGALTTLALGGYYLFGSKNARRNREKIDWWIEDAKDEALYKMSKVKNMTQDKMDEIIDSVLRRYSQFKDLKDQTMGKVRNDIKRRWNEIREETEDY